MRKIENYKRDENGQVALFFSLLAIPLMLVTTLTLDYMQAGSERRSLQDALDNAALAAANRNDIDAAEKESFAKAHFADNYANALNAQVTANASDEQVKIHATTTSQVTLGKLVGKSDLELSGTAVAAIANRNTICVLALAEDEPDSIRFSGGLNFTASQCAVHTNSRDANALVSGTGTWPRAQSFCATGGVSGRFAPHAKGECLPISDPYQHVPAPSESACMSDTMFQNQPKGDDTNLTAAPTQHMTRYADATEFKDFKTVLDAFEDGLDGLNAGQAQQKVKEIAIEYVLLRGLIEQDGRDEMRAKFNLNYNVVENKAQQIGINPNTQTGGTVPDVGPKGVPESTNYTGDNRVLKPGTYCGGLTVDGINVRFLPGDYIMKDGPLTLRNEAQAKADDVTIAFTGQNAVLQIESGAQMAIKAPKTGPREGLAFMQIPGKTNADQLPNGSHLINDRGGLTITGTMYFPQQEIIVSGEGTRVGSSSPAMAFIGYKVDMSGDASTSIVVNVDHRQADLPPIKPSAEDGARLVR